MRLFSLRTLRSNGTRFMLLHLQVNQLQLVTADVLGLQVAALRTLKVIISNGEFQPAHKATLVSWTTLDLELDLVQFRIRHQRLKTKTQRLWIDTGQFSNPQSDAVRLASRISRCLNCHGFEHRNGNTHFVHGVSANAWQLIPGQHVHYARSS